MPKKTVQDEIAALKEQRSQAIQAAQPADWGDTPIDEQRRQTAKILASDEVQEIERQISELRARQED